MKLWQKRLVLLLSGVAVLYSSCSTPRTQIVDLRCEYAANPLGLTAERPRLSWRLVAGRNGAGQTAYRILVASSETKLRHNVGDLWDTGKVASVRNAQIPYAGKRLSPLQRAYWKVCVWDEKGRPVAWSAPAWWEMGLRPEDWQARWIGSDEVRSVSANNTDPAFYFRKTFALPAVPQKARICVSGLGYYELYINGKKIGDHVLSPNQTNYDWRDPARLPDRRVANMGTRVLYETFDVTPYLKSGRNVVAVCLGNGWYFLTGTEERRSLSYGRPRLLAQLTAVLPSGRKVTLVSDSTWKVSTGPIVHNGVYSGEVYDARLEMPGWATADFDDSAWGNAAEVRAPTGRLIGQISPPDRVVRTLRPVSVETLGTGTYRFDFGQMLSGWVQLRVSGPRGAALHLRFVEDSKADYGQRDTYILKGEGNETWEPRFTWHAFRYLEVVRPPFPLTSDNVRARVVNTDVAEIGTFESSNRLFNRILENYKRTQLANMHGGVPSDCPHRERRGYTGDGQISAPAALYNFDMAAFYTKWMADIADAQNQRTGYVPNTAPYENGGGGTAWGSAVVLIPWDMYLFYGDVRVLRKNYVAMKKWVAYLSRQRDADGLIQERELGEWVPPEPTAVPASLVSSAYFYRDLVLLSKIARILGHEQDAGRFEALALKTRAAFNRRYLDPERASYSIGRQGANVFALGFDLVPDSLRAAVFATLVKHIEEDTKGHFDTGMMATPLLLEVLTRYGRPDLAYTVMNQRDFPSFGYEIENGATTIWETWAGDASHSHPMFGSVCAWFYYGLAGIQPDEAEPGFRHIVFKPNPVRGLKFVKASYQSLRGRIASEWTVEDGTFKLRVTVPPTAKASVFVPARSAQTVTVQGEPAHLLGVQRNLAQFEIGSGRYVFISRRLDGLLPKPALPAPRIVPRDTLVFLPRSVLVKIETEVPEAEIRFTTDGSEPDAGSPLYQGAFRVSQRTQVRARVFKSGFPPGFVACSRIDVADSARNGLRATYFQGSDWKRLPDFQLLKPVRHWHVYRLSLDDIHPPDEKFGLVFRGEIAIPRTGAYTFYLVSNDGAELRIDNKCVVNNDGLHGALEKSGRVTLSAGRHKIEVRYFQAGGGMLLKAFYSGPGLPRQEIPASALFAE